MIKPHRSEVSVKISFIGDKHYKQKHNGDYTQQRYIVMKEVMHKGCVTSTFSKCASRVAGWVKLDREKT